MREPSVGSEAVSNPPQLPTDLWRNEVHDRVAGYRKRRGRRLEGAFSMRFAFPPIEPLASAAIGLVDREAEPQAVHKEELQESDEVISADVLIAEIMATPAAPTALSPEPYPPALTIEPTETDTDSAVEPAASFLADIVTAPDPVLAPPPVRPGRGKRRVIAFPRPPSPPQASYRLADPILPEQPRILDVPEELEAYSTTPLLDGLQLPYAPQTVAAPPPDHIELPFRAANISRRLYAGLVDCGLVLAAAAAFAAGAYRLMPRLVFGKPVLIAAGAMLVLLWAAYQYLFTMYSGATPGMRALHLRLSTFRGGRLCWRHRRGRVIGLYFSAASLMMGLLWAFVDVDALCWHDRLSRTYLARRE